MGPKESPWRYYLRMVPAMYRARRDPTYSPHEPRPDGRFQAAWRAVEWAVHDWRKWAR